MKYGLIFVFDLNHLSVIEIYNVQLKFAELLLNYNFFLILTKISHMFRDTHVVLKCNFLLYFWNITVHIERT